jgi:hypothetical protein
MRTGANAKTRTCRRWGRAAWVWPQRHEWLGDAHNSGTRCRWHEVEATTAQWPALPTHVRVESSSINDSRSGSDGRAQSGSAGYGGSRLAMRCAGRGQTRGAEWPHVVTMRTESGNRGACSCMIFKARPKTKLPGLKLNHLHYAKESISSYQ